jgi:hypothetical protein
MLLDAFGASPEAAAVLLAAVCTECEILLGRKPGSAYVLHLWGTALMRQGRMASDVADADRLYASAVSKLDAGLSIAPEDARIPLDRNATLLLRSDLHPGQAGTVYLTQVCRHCETQVHANPHDSAAYTFWATAFWRLASRAAPADADAMLAQVEEKLAAALSIARDSGAIMDALAALLERRSRTRSGAEGEAFRRRSAEYCAAAAELPASDSSAMMFRAFALFNCARHDRGADMQRRVSAAMLDALSTASAYCDVALAARGILFWTQAVCSGGEESLRLLREASARFTEAETYAPRSCAYDLACVHALLGEPEECRRWLEISLEPGARVSREEMASEPYLENVRGYDWFQSRLAAPSTT